MKIHKDIDGNDLLIDTKVAFIDNVEKCLYKGTVVSSTEKRVKIKLKDSFIVQSRIPKNVVKLFNQ